jgi:MIP family channel proteins
LKACGAEFFATTIFIFIATGTVVFGCHSADTSTQAASAATGQVVQPEDCFLNNSRVLTIATSFGFAIFVAVYLSASFSGGHVNPAVTLAFLITKKVTLMRASAYWFCQLTGAILGSSFVYAVDRTGWHASTGGTNRLLPGISKASGWLMETLLTMTLVFVVFAATDTNRAKISTHLPVLAPLAIGMAVFICHLAAVAIDGCSINPARSFGPAVVSGVFTDQWIFWVGPFSGALVAALLYELFFRPSGPIKHADDEGEKHPHQDTDVEAGDMDDQKPTLQLPPFSGVRGAYKDARPIKVILAEEVPPGTDNLHSSNVGVRHEMDPAAHGHLPQQGGVRPRTVAPETHM